MLGKLKKVSPETLIPTLLDSVRAAHEAHLSTTSYAEHKTLNKYYDKMPDLVDSFAEAYMGKYGRCTFKSCTPIPYTEFTSRLPEIHKDVITLTGECKDPDLANLLQEISAFIKSTLYLLTLS